MQDYFRNKKAMENIIVVIILGLLVFMVTLGLYANTQNKVNNMKPYLTECKLTLGAEKLTDNLHFLSSKINDACYTVKLNNLNDFRRPGDIQLYIANRMAQSWDITWEGSHNLFDDDGRFRIAGSDCRVFFELDYTHPKYDGVINKSQMLEFMLDTEYEIKGMTYNQYLQGKNMNGAWLITDDIEPGNIYAISIVNPHDTNTLTKWTVGTAVGIATVVTTVGTLGFGTAALATAAVGGGAIGGASAMSFEQLVNSDGVNTLIILSKMENVPSNCVYRGVEV